MNPRDCAGILPFSHCVRSAGTEDFGIGLIGALEGLVEIDHCALVNVKPRHAEMAAFASRRRGAGVGIGVGAQLTQAYIGGCYREDPLVREFSISGDALATPSMRSLMPASTFNEAYFERFFVEPGLVDKLSIVVPDVEHMSYLSLYRSKEMGCFTDQDKARIWAFTELLASLVSIHTRLCATPRVPREVSVKWHTALSERERCVAKLLGRGETAKTVGAMLELSPASVVTYKQRALAKLGITTQRELVALTALLG
ncbi:helix-turn-helix transcriptional regulator [Caballeronia sp. LZ065]|uniref:helix-turn-helix transcriptional regulator n=1 Tax=Caballeronia sp. LZ065 TaxID=3038571 RepID=UPI0028542625|nr:helix-turn-helix transcriptional regulator [Caballeronia sp. LZ065]MDR5781636.1 helix-turn-helix transcriptional regulator [Caballeronia sp. LZ065]